MGVGREFADLLADLVKLAALLTTFDVIAMVQSPFAGGTNPLMDARRPPITAG
jgi:hypothetical protein